MIKTLDSECDVIDNEIKRLQELKKQRSNFTQSLKDRLKNAMQAMELTEIKTALNKINFRKSESVEIIDESILPNNVLIYEPKIDKKKIKEIIKNGGVVLGAEIVVNQNLQIK